MANVINLIKGNVYYYCTFYDTEFNYPSIDTFVYEGLDEEFGHLFKNLSDSHGFYSFKQGEISSILDKAELSKWILKKHSPRVCSEEYIYVTS